jgi:hypothetical protein
MLDRLNQNPIKHLFSEADLSPENERMVEKKNEPDTAGSREFLT